MKKRIWMFLTMLALTATVHATTNDLTGLLQQGLFEEEADRNLDAAISNYQTLASSFDKDRQVAATAIFRLGECYRKLGQTNEAAAQYQRIVRDFGDQQTLVTLSQQNLAGMGATSNNPSPARAGESVGLSNLRSQYALLKSQLEQARKETNSEIVAELFNDNKELAEQLRLDLSMVIPSGSDRQMLDRVEADRQRIFEFQEIRLKSLESAIKDQEAREGITPENTLSITTSDTLQQLQDALTKEQLEYNQKESKLATLKRLSREELRKALPTVVPDSRLETLMGELDVAQQNLLSIKPDYAANHPKTMAAQAQVDDLEMKVNGRIEGIIAGLQAQLDASEVHMDFIKKQIAGLQGSGKAQLARSASEQAPITDEEEKEIRRIQQMIQNSPDLINVGSVGANGNWTPLYQAARAGWLRVAGFLLDHGANVDADSGPDGKPLYAAAEFGNQAMVELLLSHGADVNARSGPAGETALHVAAERGFAAVTETLLKQKADVNARDFNERTPLHLAAGTGQVGTTKLLLAHGADLNAKDGQGSTPLLDALLSGYQRHVAAVQTLLAAKPDVNMVFRDGGTVLGSAAAQGFKEIVKSLLEAKADPNGGTTNLPLTAAVELGSSGYQSLTEAIQSGVGNRSNICWMLLQAGADPNRPDPAPLQQRGQGGYISGTERVSLSPFQRAVILGQTDIVKLLLDHHADANAAGFYQNTLLWEAVTGKRSEMAEALLAHGADANVRNDQDETLVAWAVAQGERKIVEALLEHGADVNARSRSDVTTALHIAVQKGNGELVAFLIANKADVNAQDRYGKTPIDYAKEKQGQAASGPGIVRPLRAGEGAPGPTWVISSPEDIIKLLRAHGAVDELPNFKAIRVNREGLSAPILAFERQSNDWNHYTLLETVLQAYSGANIWVGNNLRSRESVLRFPDLKRIIIHRPNQASLGRKREIAVDLLNDTNGIDCGKDVPVEFGDIVEIPIRDYSLGEAEVGLTQSQAKNLRDCLEKTVRLVVRGESRELTPYAGSAFVLQTLQMPEAKSLLLASSDLAHVKVTRKDPSTGKATAFIVDATALRGFQDLWLENGDTIEVPEKSGE